MSTDVAPLMLLLAATSVDITKSCTLLMMGGKHRLKHAELINVNKSK